MRIRLVVIGIFLGLTLAAFGTVYALSYDGESYCRDHPAWPNGTYLGQMHRQHIDHYVKHFGEAGACERWANDQEKSAVEGLRRKGYQVVQIADNVPYVYNCGDQQAIPVKWKITHSRRYTYLIIDFVIANHHGYIDTLDPDKGVYRSIPFTLDVKDKDGETIPRLGAFGDKQKYEGYIIMIPGLVYHHNRDYIYSSHAAWVIHPNDVARFDDGACVKLNIELDPFIHLSGD